MSFQNSPIASDLRHESIVTMTVKVHGKPYRIFSDSYLSTQAVRAEIPSILLESPGLPEIKESFKHCGLHILPILTDRRRV